MLLKKWDHLYVKISLAGTAPKPSQTVLIMFSRWLILIVSKVAGALKVAYFFEYHFDSQWPYQSLSKTF